MDTNYEPNSLKKYYHQIVPILQKEKTQAYLMVIFSLFTMSFFGFFAIRPTVKTIATLQKQIEDRSFVDSELEKKINALIAAQAEYRKIEPVIPQIYSLLPEKPEVTTLLIKLEDLLLERQASISAISFEPIVLYGEEARVAPKAPTPANTPPENVLGATSPTGFSLTVAFEGPYTELVQILQRLTKLDRIVAIDSAEFSSGAASSTGISSLVVNLKSQSFYFSSKE